MLCLYLKYIYIYIQSVTIILELMRYCIMRGSKLHGGGSTAGQLYSPVWAFAQLPTRFHRRWWCHAMPYHGPMYLCNTHGAMEHITLGMVIRMSLTWYRGRTTRPWGYHGRYNRSALASCSWHSRKHVTQPDERRPLNVLYNGWLSNPKVNRFGSDRRSEIAQRRR